MFTCLMLFFGNLIYCIYFIKQRILEETCCLSLKCFLLQVFLKGLVGFLPSSFKVTVDRVSCSKGLVRIILKMVLRAFCNIKKLQHPTSLQQQ